MLSAYRRSSARAVLLANASLKPRLFTSAFPVRSQYSEEPIESEQPLDRPKWTVEQSSLLKQPFLLNYKISRQPRINSASSYHQCPPTAQSEQGLKLPDGQDLESIVYRPGDLHKDILGSPIVSGFIGPCRKVGKLLFAPLTRAGKTVQIVCSKEDRPEIFEALRAVNVNSAIEIVGHVKEKQAKSNPDRAVDPEVIRWTEIELVVEDFKLLSKFPDDISVGEVAKYGPEQRHLQLRFDEELAGIMRFRSNMTRKAHDSMRDFTNIDTPILFKSTPEGAREFLVPTRNAGMAYALPQSPQQYKQILMASGIDKYYQMAHCFRDEDLRADRQPEFMQLDLEMAFCKGADVRKRVETLITLLFYVASNMTRTGHYKVKVEDLPNGAFPVTTYKQAMSRHGVDKPDLRIKDEITDVTNIIPEQLKKMMTSLEDPIIETFKYNLSASPSEVRQFVSEIMDSPELRPFHSSPDGPPSVFIYDPSKPLSNLHAFGHDSYPVLESHFLTVETEKRGRVKSTAENAEQQVEGQAEAEAFQSGDLIIMQARPNARFNGGSTAIGRLRTLIHKAAVEKGYMTMPKGFEPLWVIDFPLFTPNNETDPGQGGTRGFSATHHPFTSPKTDRDVELCVTDPLEAIADHYDLVINGVELGGGSARIHDAEMQEYILKEVIGMKQERVEDFRHLLEALRAGCPPHAGLALGWDRLIAVMMGRESIRDVLAFPKDGKGKDALVGSPSEMTDGQQVTYHLKVLKE